MMQKIRWFLLILGSVLLLAAILQNNAATTVNLLWLERSIPLSVLLITTTVIGFLLGALMTASMLRRRSGTKEPTTSLDSQTAEKQSLGQVR